MARKLRVPISDLWQGTSTQPDQKRRGGQVESALNVRLDPIDGSRKRNATNLIRDFPELGSTDYFWASLREFVIAIGSGGVFIKDRSGDAITVTYGTGALTYLSTATDWTDFDLVAYLNSVVILNRQVQPLTTTTPNYTVAGEADTYSQLPTNAASGSTYLVIDTEGENPGGHYRATAANPTLAQWERIAAPNDANGRWVASTMPFQLLYTESTNSFTLQALTWEDRKSGSSITNPRPSWVSEGLRCITIWGNRLWFYGKTAFSSTEALASIQDGLNLWLDDVTTPVDTDPISLNIDQPNAGIPFRAAPVGQDLLITCENAVIAFTSGDAPPSLLKFNVRSRMVASLRSQDAPISTNGNEAVIIDRLKDIHLFGYGGALNGITYGGKINEHRRDILTNLTPTRPFFIDEAIFIPTTERTVAVFDRYVVGQEVVQLAWGTFEFSDPLVYMDGWQDLYYLIQKGDTYSLLSYLHKADYSEELPYSVRLDRLESTTPVSYDPETNLTRFDVSNRDATSDTYLVDVQSGAIRLRRPVEGGVSGSSAYFKGNIAGGTYLIGFGYDCELEMSKLVLGRMLVMLQRMAVYHTATTDYEVWGGREGDSLRLLYRFNAARRRYDIGDNGVEEGDIGFTLAGDARDFRLVLRCNNPGTATWVSLEFTVNAVGE